MTYVFILETAFLKYIYTEELLRGCELFLTSQVYKVMREGKNKYQERLHKTSKFLYMGKG